MAHLLLRKAFLGLLAPFPKSSASRMGNMEDAILTHKYFKEIGMFMKNTAFSWDIVDKPLLSLSETDLQQEHAPSEAEQYMNEQQLIYFKEKLLCWREQLFNESSSTLNLMKEDSGREIDILDQGALETHMALKLNTCSRYYKLTQKINDALERIKDGSYGYCEETGEPIGLKRLEARPIATLSLEAQEWHEQKERRLKMRR